jgi:hypothetical protein
MNFHKLQQVPVNNAELVAVLGLTYNFYYESYSLYRNYGALVLL